MDCAMVTAMFGSAYGHTGIGERRQELVTGRVGVRLAGTTVAAAMRPAEMASAPAAFTETPKKPEMTVMEVYFRGSRIRITAVTSGTLLYFCHISNTDR